jgi:tRNA(Ile)-lysidine synthase
MSLTADALRLAAVEVFRARPVRHLGLAVSGGSDSMAMLCLIVPWARATGMAVSVATVDHGLRVEAVAEAAFVGRVCAGLGVAHRVLAWRGWDGRGNLQASARAARTGLLAAWARDVGAEAVALGHTLDDQAETVLLRLLRGSGVDGLSGMEADREEGGLRWVRPLIGLRREALREFLRAEGRDWVEDPSNADERFDRVKARRALEALGPLGVEAEGLVATAGRMRVARRALEDYAGRAAAEVARVEGGDVVFDRAGFDALPEETRLRLWSGAVRWVGAGAYRPRLDALRAALAEVAEGRRRTLQGAVLSRGRGVWRVTRELAAVRDLRVQVGEVWDRWIVEGPEGEVRALGAAVDGVPGWRAAGLPRATVMASPAVWRGETLVAAPVAGFGQGWTARIVTVWPALTLSH